MDQHELLLSTDRQYPLVTYDVLTHENLAETISKAVSKLPPNAIVIGGEIVVTEAWDSATSDSLDLGDADNTSRYLSAVDLQATGRTALTLTGHKYAESAEILADYTQDDGTEGDGATQGEAILMLHYVVAGRSNENGYN